MSTHIDYVPPPTVAEFIESEKYYNFIVGPIGSGKTTGMIMKILYHALRQTPSPIDGIRRTRFVVVRNTNRMLEDTTLKSWFGWFQPGVAGDWLSSKKLWTFQFGDVHCEVLFRPLDSPEDVKNVLSLEITGACIDEFVDINQDIVEALASRCGRYPSKKDGGPRWRGMWGASNPGNEDVWWYDWLYAPWEAQPDGSTKEQVLGYFQQPSGFAYNAENLDHLDGGRDYYNRAAFGKGDDWIKQFIEVKWGFSLRGKPVHRSFKETLHVSPLPLRYNPLLPLVIGFDAGLTPAALLGQMNPHGQLMVLAEVVSENMGAERFCLERLLPLLATRFPRPNLVVRADPATAQRSQTNEVTVKQILEKHLKVRVKNDGSNSLADRLGAVEHYLCRLTDTGPAMIIDPSCVQYIRGMKSGYRYAVNAKGMTADMPEKNQYSHVHDAGQYMCQEFKGGEFREARRRTALSVGFGHSQNSYTY